MKFGLFDQNDASGLPPHEQYENRLQLIELCDRSGFHIYQVSEHHGTPLSLTPSPSVWLAAVAQRTKRIRLGPLVYLLPIYNPIRLAEEICMLDQLSGGRFEFGVGRGASPHEIRFLGVRPEEAADIHREAFDVVMQGVTTGRVNHSGRWQLDDVPLAVRPFQRPHPPIWYASASPESAVWPAENGYNVIAGGPIERVASVAAGYREAFAKAHPNAETMPLIGMNRYVVVADTDAEAEAIARKAWVTFYESFILLWKKLGGQPVNAKLPPEIGPLLEGGLAIAGRPETVAAKLHEQIARAKVTFLSGSFVFGDMRHDAARHSLELFASKVMPELSSIGEPRASAPSLAEA